MSFLFGGASNAQTPQPLGSINIQTSIYGSCIPLACGTVRIAGNLIWYGDFTAHAVSQGAGKGGLGGGGKNVTSYTYSASFIVALGEGGFDGTQGIGTVWVSKAIKTMAEVGLTFFKGAVGQGPWSYLITSGDNPKTLAVREAAIIPNVSPYTYQVDYFSTFIADLGVTHAGAGWTKVASNPGHQQYSVNPATGTYTFSSLDANTAVNVNYSYTGSLAYSGLTYVAGSNINLGSSGQLPQFNFEWQALDIYPGQQDALPGQWITDLLTHPLFGAGFPAARLGDLTVYNNYCIGMGFFLSAKYTSQSDGASMISDIVEYTNSAVIWSNGQLQIVPYGEQNVGSYVAPAAPEFSLGDDDFLENVPPVKLTRKSQMDAYNSITMEFENRANRYNVETIEVKDLNGIQLYGYRPDTSRSTHLFANKNIVQQAAQLILNREQIRNTYSLRLGWKYIVLDCMDIVAITDVNLGLNAQWVRITQIDEDDKGELTITAEEYLSGTGSAPVYNFDQPSGYGADLGTDPGLCNAPVIFEAPAALDGQLEICVAVSGGANWGGCDVYASTDGETYTLVGSILGNTRMGVLTAALPAGSSPDETDTLSVNLAESRATLLGGTQQDATLLNTLCYVDGEWLAYATATLTAANQYNLGYLVRGAYGSTIGSHAVGAPFVRIDLDLAKYVYDAALIGRTIYIKCLGKNLWNVSPTDLSTCTAYPYTITGLALAGLAITVANSAIPQINAAANDRQITPAEKTMLYDDWSAIYANANPTNGTLHVLAQALGVSTTAFDAAFSSLNTYVNTKLTLFANLNAVTKLSAASSSITEWDDEWDGYYEAAETLDAAIHTAASQKALWAQVTGAGTPQSGSTVGGYISNLRIYSSTSAPYTMVNVTADLIMVGDTSGNHVSLTNLSQQLNITTSGANGLDTGTVTANVWYYLYEIYNPTTTTAALLMSLSATSPTMPSGYTMKKLISACIPSSSTSLPEFTQEGLEYSFTEPYGFTQSGGQPTWPTLKSVAIGIPPSPLVSSVKAALGFYVLPTSGTNDAMLGIDSSGTIWLALHSPTVGSAIINTPVTSTWMPVETSQTLYWGMSGTGNGQMMMFILGCHLNL
jgi:hypothetical protein